MIPKDLIHYSAHKEESKNVSSAMEPTHREKVPNEKVERVGAVLALLAFFLIISFRGLSATLLILGTLLIVVNGALYWSRRNVDYLWIVVVGVAGCVFYLIDLLFFQ